MSHSTLAALLSKHPESVALAEVMLAEKGTPLCSFAAQDVPKAIASVLDPVITRELADPVIEDVTLDGFELLSELELL